MALARAPITYARAIVTAPGTSVVAVGSDGVTAAPVPDNCYTILVTNTSVADVGLVGVGTVPTALTAGVNATYLGAGSTLTLGINTQATRGVMDEAQQTGSGLIFDATAAMTMIITYLNKFGEP